MPLHRGALMLRCQVASIEMAEDVVDATAQNLGKHSSILTWVMWEHFGYAPNVLQQSNFEDFMLCNIQYIGQQHSAGEQDTLHTQHTKSVRFKIVRLYWTWPQTDSPGFLHVAKDFWKICLQEVSSLLALCCHVIPATPKARKSKADQKQVRPLKGFWEGNKVNQRSCNFGSHLVHFRQLPSTLTFGLALTYFWVLKVWGSEGPTSGVTFPGFF